MDVYLCEHKEWCSYFASEILNTAYLAKFWISMTWHLFLTQNYNTTWHLLNIEHTPSLFMVNKIQNHCSVNPFGHVYSRKSNTTRLHVITDNKLQIICPCLSRLLILHAHNFTIHYLEMPCEMLTSYISHLNCN